MKLTVLAPSLLALASSAALAQDQSARLGFMTMNDAFEPVPFGLVLAESGGNGTWLDSDADGETAYLDYSASTPLTLEFQEVQTKALDGYFDAVTIGQQFTLSVAELGSFVDRQTTYAFCQPMARKLQFSSPSDLLVGDLQSGWFASGFVDSSGVESVYDFSAWCAELPTEDGISAYFAYSNGVHVSTYQHGVLFRLDADVSLGDGGFELVIDAKGYTYDEVQGPIVQTVYVGDHVQGNGLDAEVTAYEPGAVTVHVSGQLHKGDNLVLFENASGRGQIRRAKNLESVPFVAAPLPAKSCEVPKPASSDIQLGEANTCEPPESFSIATVAHACPDDANCEARFYWIGPATCSPCGQPPLQLKRCFSASGGVSAGMDLGNFLEISLNGQISGSICIDSQAAPGTCRRDYVGVTHCVKVCEIEYMKLGHPGTYFTDVEFWCLGADTVVSTMDCKIGDGNCDD